MSYIAPDLVTPSLQKTQKLLFPFSWSIWLKFAVLVFFVGGMGGGFNFPTELFDLMEQYWEIVVAIMIVAMALGIFLFFLRCVFQFCLLESISTGNVSVFGYFNKHLSKGVSLFLLWIVSGLAFLVVLGALWLPFAGTLLSFVEGSDTLTAVLGPLIGVGVVSCLILLVYLIFSGLVSNFTIYYMFVHNVKAWPAFKVTWQLFRQKFGELVILWLISAGLGIVSVMGILLIFVLLLLALIIVGGVLFMIGFGLTMVAPILMVPLIVIGVVVAILLLFVFIIGMLMASVPFVVYFEYLRLDFMKELSGSLSSKKVIAKSVRKTKKTA